jgi:hypothetical protein
MNLETKMNVRRAIIALVKKKQTEGLTSIHWHEIMQAVKDSGIIDDQLSKRNIKKWTHVRAQLQSLVWLERLTRTADMTVEEYTIIPFWSKTA